MGGLSVVEDEEAIGKREIGVSHACSHVHSRHRRAKSASEKKLDVSGGGVLQFIRRGQNESHEFPPSRKTRRAQSPFHDLSTDINSKTSSNHRASLENDIEQLQLRLQQEKSMRMMLERAMGRASSTLSPGHRHFAAQTKELISEIEHLEEEVTNREQHVLSLYRTIFEHCASRPTSAQSSGMASPAHMKHDSRKQRHPSVISSAFCSSKKFPLRSFQALVSNNDLGKRNSLSQSKSRLASVLSGNTNIQFENIYSNPAKVTTMEKTSVIRTLKDHLYQCPSKLSEEMVRCMAAVYCGLRTAASANPEKNRSPLLSRSSTNVILPQRGIGEIRGWSCKSMVEISWISTDKNQFSRASYAINNYRVLVEQLERVNVSRLDSKAQTAFWINVYNSLIMHAYLAYGIPHSSLRRLALFHKAAYNIGGHVISANAMEHSIFGFHTPRIGWWLETIFSTAMRKKYGEERQVISSKFGLPSSEPLVCFALCTGAFSDPMLKVYTAANVIDELEAAKLEFLQANVVIKKSRKVFLPKVLERFAKEASIGGSDVLLKWVTDNVDKKLHDSIQKCFDRKTNMKASQIIDWVPYNSRFRYAFSKDLTEKPWWG